MTNLRLDRKEEPEEPKQGPGKLISCPDCGFSISKRARTCVHCGRPLTSFMARMVAMALLACLLWALFEYSKTI